MSNVASETADPRTQWQSRTGFILAALGAAIGIGNIWRFAFVIGENGGGAFLIIYVGAVLVIGVPMLLGELAFGRAARREAVSAFAKVGRGPLWRLAGLLGVAASFIILTYYGVITGWAIRYFLDFAVWSDPASPGTAVARFEAFTSQAVQPLLWFALAMTAAVVIVAGGVEGGIERASKVLMPLMAALLVGLALHSLTLPGAGRGLAFLFVPDWGAFANPRTYLAAIGQAFFSLGLAMGVLVTYGSYLPRDIDLPKAAVAIALGDTLFAIITAIVIFPAVFSFGMDPGQGPALAFVTLPEIFATMAGGRVVGAAFFGLLVLAAVTSLVALVEIAAAFAVECWGWRRLRAVFAIAGAAFLLGVPSSLGFGTWSQVRIAGLPILDAVDFGASNVLLPLSGLAIAAFFGWHWRDEAAALGLRSTWMIWLWRCSIRYLVPATIVVVLLRALPTG